MAKNEHYVNRVVSQSESSITSPESSANQNQALRRHYVTRELSARVEDPSRLSARVGSL